MTKTFTCEPRTDMFSALKRTTLRRTGAIRSSLALALTILTGSIAFASPAQDLFDAVFSRLKTNYYGYSTADLESLGTRYQAALDEACRKTKDSCPFEVAQPVVTQLTASLGDRHTYYIDPERYADRLRARAGQGPTSPRIGIVTASLPNSSDRVIIDVLGNSPAELAGLQRGDRIIALNGKASSEYENADEFQKAISTLASAANTFKITILRREERLELSLKGEQITSPNLPTLRRIGDIGVLRIPTFDVSGQVARRVHALVRTARQEGLGKLIIDVRDNPGGLVTEVAASIGAFLPQVTLTLSERNESTPYHFEDGQLSIGIFGLKVELFKIETPTQFTGSLVVLTNGRSASGAELLAQALHDAGIASVIGEPTAGVGNTSTLEYRLPNGGALAITQARVSDNIGEQNPERVQPDVVITDDLQALSEGHDLPLEQALVTLGTSPSAKPSSNPQS